MTPPASFAVWAPHARGVTLHLREGTAERDVAMRQAGDGWWEPADDLGAVAADAEYGFRLDDDAAVLPDPRSARLPRGVHGLTRRYDHGAYRWRDGAWTGRVLPGSVVYELHIGTFTPEGTLDSAIARLDHLVGLGVDFVELLPVNGFNGTHNWGYDGVAWYAVHEPYGGPDAYKRFVDACHSRGLGVIQDVVHNHLGPSGNYLPRFGPYLADAGRSTWGVLVNLDGPHSTEVRRYIIDNALMWLRDYHVDGLRLDAVHALHDSGATHLLEQLATEVETLSTHLRRPLTLVAESDLNDPKLVTSRDAGGYGLTAQWSDDFHHCLHGLLTGERQGYYGDFGSLPSLAKVLTRGFFHDGTWSSFRNRLHGGQIDTRTLPGYRLLGYLQDHDQIGNRATGDRISATLSPGLLAVGATLVMTSPFTPMIFMGEEWGARTPWLFFTSHPEPELAVATAEGRKAEFAEHGWDTDDVPDPQDPETFLRSKLDWSEMDGPDHAELLRVYRELIMLRRTRPELTEPWLHRVEVSYDEDARWLVVSRGTLRVAVNLAGTDQTVPLDGEPTSTVFSTSAGSRAGHGCVVLPAGSAAILELRSR